MNPVQPCEVPPGALLRKYQHGPGYVDCYVTEVAGAVTQSAYVEAFYTTPLFKLERAILKWLAGRPSSDDEAKALAGDTRRSFAAWRVEDRTTDELLLADFTGRTRSWLMTSCRDNATRLYFGSAVVPKPNARKGDLGFVYHSLLGFHKVYSRALLRAARSRVQNGSR